MPKATAPQSLDRDWFTVGQAAAYLQCCTRTVHRYLDSGLLSASQLVPGGTIRISTISIEKLLEQTRH
ncbi:MAG: helix-turn-helix domain-containing protein [Terracidiphilus sp.]|jgi:excisionase family DNA binding protein